MQDHLFQEIPCETPMPRKDLSPHVYNIVSRDGYCIKSDELYIIVQLRILKRNATGQYVAMTEGEPVAPVNNFLYSAFKVTTLGHSMLVYCAKNAFHRVLSCLSMGSKCIKIWNIN